MSSAHVATPPLVSNFVSNSSALPPSSSSRVAVAMASELTVSLSLTATAAPEVTSTAAAVVLASSYTWLELLLRFTIVSYPDRVLPALWFALGVPSNVLCVHVWLLRQLRHSSSIYLAALAAADLAQLLLYVPTYLESRFLIVPPSYYGVCELYNVLHVTVQYIPPCLMIVFSAERWFVVSYPFLSQRVCNVRLALIVTGVISFACLLIGSMQIFVYAHDHEKGTCGDHPALNEPDSLRAQVIAVWNILFDLAFFFVCSLLILFFNIGVIVVTRRSAKSDLVRHTQRLKSVHLQMTPIPISSSAASQSQSPLLPKRTLLETKSAGTGAGNGERVGSVIADCNGNSTPLTLKRDRTQSDMTNLNLRPSVNNSPTAASGVRRSDLLRTQGNGAPAGNGTGNGNGAARASFLQSLARRKSAGTRDRVGGGGGRSESRKSAVTTVALLSISFYYILTTLPVATCMVVSRYFPPGNPNMPLDAVPDDPEWRAFFAFRTVRNIIVDLALSHYALFFYIYLLTSPVFRRASLQVLARYMPCVFRTCYERVRRRSLLASTALNTACGGMPASVTITAPSSSFSRPHSTPSS